MRSDRDSEINELAKIVESLSVSHDRTATADSGKFTSYLQSLPFLSAPHQSREATAEDYPVQLPTRYSRFIWGEESQYCYTPEEVKLLTQIKAEFNQLVAKKPPEPAFFDLQQEKSWRDMMVCSLPTYKELTQRLESGSFTLAHRDGKNTRVYPLWKFADDMAKQIANWQALRIKYQKTSRMNDPVMLAFEHLRHWFFHELAFKECKKEELDNIAAMQSYVKNLIHLVPNFGADRLRLHEIQQSLADATDIMANCIANQKLPELLSSVIIAGKSLETTIATYLHFLMIDEEVADNCASDFLEGGRRNCQTSPVCKLYDAAHATAENAGELVHFQPLNKFYQLVGTTEVNGVKQMQLKLRIDLLKLSNIKFASFVTDADKERYLQAVATLDTLVSVRQTLEQFHHTQEKLGTYLFAMKYLDKMNQLAHNYNQLVAKQKSLLKELIRATDQGVNQLLRRPGGKSKNHFEKNLSALETKVVEKGKTVMLQLEAYCQKTTESVAKYQEEMRRLVTDIHSGAAKREIETEMQSLYVQIQNLNALLPVIVNGEQLILENSTSLLPAADAPALQPPSQPLSPRYDTLVRDTEILTDPMTEAPIFTYRAFRAGKEVGVIQFYNKPELHLSEEAKRHNIVLMSGIFCEMASEELSAELCLSPEQRESQRLIYSVANAGFNGAVYGGANVLQKVLQNSGIAAVPATIARESFFYGIMFVFRYNQYCNHEYAHADPFHHTKAMWWAAMDTSKLAVANYALKGVSWLADHSATFLKKHHWPKLAWGAAKINSLTHFGFFANHALNRGMTEAVATQAVGMAAQVATEWSGDQLFLAKPNKSASP